MMRVLAAAVLLGSPFAANAASVGSHAYVYGLVPDLSGGTTLEEAAADRYSDDTALDGPDRTAAAMIDVAGTVYKGTSALDIRSGAHSSSVGVADAIPPGNFASAEATSFETFTVRGDGAVTFRLGLSAGWSLPTFVGAEDPGGLFLTGRMHVAELGDADGADLFHRVLLGPNDSGSVGSVTDELVHVLDVTDGGSYMFNTWVVSELRNSADDGFASLAGLLSVSSEPGVSVLFGYPAFLSYAATPAPVPLPAPLALLLSCVGALTVFRRRGVLGLMSMLILVGSLSIGDPVQAQSARSDPEARSAPADIEEPQGGSTVPPPVWIVIGILVGIVLIAASLNSSDAGAAFLPPS